MSYNNLCKEIENARMYAAMLEASLRRSTEICRRTCQHSYVHEREFDGHTTKSVYTCEKCGDFTMMRPAQEQMSNTSCGTSKN